MPMYRFHFQMPDLPEDIQRYTISTWGGHPGTAFSRAWHKLRRVPVYYASPKISPRMKNVDVHITKLGDEENNPLDGPGFRT